MSKSLHFVAFLADWKCLLHPPSVLNTCFQYTFAPSIRLGLVLLRLKFICYNPDGVLQPRQIKKNFAFERTLLAWLFMFWIDFCLVLFKPILCIFLTLANNWSAVVFVKLYFFAKRSMRYLLHHEGAFFFTPIARSGIQVHGSSITCIDPHQNARGFCCANKRT